MAGGAGPGPSLRSQWLGEKIRELRKGRRMSLRDVGEYLQRDAGTLSRYENGELVVRRGDLLALMDLYGVSDERERANLEQLREEAWRKGWWDQHRQDLGNDFINQPWLESRAECVCSYQHMVVHGLIQTRGYAEAVIRNAERGQADEDQIQRWVDFRMDRQHIFAGAEAAVLRVILEESVLRRQIGDTEVWKDQLRNLLSVGQRGNIELRVMPFDRAPHAGHQGAFELFKMPEPYPEVAYVDTLAGILYIEEPRAQRFSQAWDDLYERALDPEASARMITDRLKEIQ